jgi:hypothetical protein
VWVLNALWLAPAVLWLSHGYANPQASPLDDLYLVLTALFWIGHRLSSAYVAYCTEAYRPLLRRQPLRFVVVPTIVVAACFAILLPADEALPWTRGERVVALAIVDYVFLAHHFVAQHFGALALYRGRAGRGGCLRTRRADRLFTVVVGGALVVLADLLSGAVAYQDRWLDAAVDPAWLDAVANDVRGGATVALLVATAAMIVAELVAARPSPPRLLYVLGLATMVGLALRARSPFLFVVVWTAQHWIVATGLAAEVATGECARMDQHVPRVLRAINGRAWAVALLLIVASFVLLPIFEVEASFDGGGAYYGDRIFGAFAAGLRESSWVPALLAVGFATGFVHYLLDRAVYRLSDPEIRRAARALTLDSVNIRSVGPRGPSAEAPLSMKGSMLGRAAPHALGIVALALGLLLACAAPAFAESPSQKELLERLKKLEENQTKLYELMKEKDARIDALQAELEKDKGHVPAGTESQKGEPSGENMPAAAEPDKARGALSTTTATAPPAPPAEEVEEGPYGSYKAGRGFGFARTEWGEVRFGIYTYVRYLNQKALDDTFTNGLGNEVKLDRREDVELNKVKLEFRGWLIDPHFNYTLYSWTNNAAQGLGAQVVLGGNLNWVFSPKLTIGGGILSLPTTRTTQGSFPYWLTVDHRTTADEFFRGSYTMGFYAYGTQKGFGYFAMLANNLSILGVDAGQLDGDFTTVSTALWWMPTTGEYGPRQGFGDYEMHERVATRIGGHFTFSPEDRQSQPGSEDIDNTQIRLSNGTIIFTPGALAPNVGVENVKYYMADLDVGAKYMGVELSGEYYFRWLNDFVANGPLPDHNKFDHGFQAMASAMVWPKTAQLYTMGAYIFGEDGDSWEMTGGVNVWPFRRREIRVNLEYLYDRRSPIGYTAVPQSVGANGSIFNANLEMSF